MLALCAAVASVLGPYAAVLPPAGGRPASASSPPVRRLRSHAPCASLISPDAGVRYVDCVQHNRTSADRYALGPPFF